MNSSSVQVFVGRRFSPPPQRKLIQVEDKRLLDVTVVLQDLVMRFSDGIHRLFSCTGAFDNELAELTLCDLEQLAIDRDVPEVLDEAHRFGEGRVEGPTGGDNLHGRPGETHKAPRYMH